MTFNAEFPIRVPESFKSHKRHSSSEKSDDYYWCGRDSFLFAFFSVTRLPKARLERLKIWANMTIS